MKLLVQINLRIVSQFLIKLNTFTKRICTFVQREEADSESIGNGWQKARTANDFLLLIRVDGFLNYILSGNRGGSVISLK